MIPTRIHGMLDYALANALIATTWLFPWAGGGLETRLPVLMGAVMLVHNLITNYELGLVGILPMRFHLILDVFVGLFFASTPWLFGFADGVWLPHVIVGFFVMVSGVMTCGDPELPALTGQG